MSYEPRTMSRLRVCVVSPLYHPSLGGLGRQAQLLTERLSEEGVDVFVIARRMKGMPHAVFSPKVRIYRAWSIKPYLHNFEEVTPLNILVSLTFSISCALLLFLKRNKYDVVHFHGASLPLLVTLPLLKMLGKKVIAKVAAAGVGTEAGSFRGRHFGLGNLFVGALKMVDAFIATTGEIAEGLARDGFDPGKIRRIPNFIDVSVFSPFSGGVKSNTKAKTGTGDTLVVTFSGRFIPRKGIDVLLEAWKLMIREQPRARLLLLGGGPLFKDMKEKAAGLGIGNSVDFRGHVESVTDYFRMTDVFVLPSRQEGMPNSLLEAMACGLPVVATRIGGVVDIIKDNENGILVEPEDPEALARGIQRLLADRKLSEVLAANAAKTVTDSYSLESMVPRYMELYRELTNKEQEAVTG